MEERNILSREEVDAIIKSAHSAEAIESSEEADAAQGHINTNALQNIIEIVRADIENKLTVLLRKKIIVKSNPASQMNFEDFSKLIAENVVNSSFKISPVESPAIISTHERLIDLLINLLYGGKIDKQQDAKPVLGKIGLITAEKINLIMMECMISGCKEYGAFNVEEYKTSTNFNVVNNITAEEIIYSVEFIVQIEEVEATTRISLTEEFLIKLIPVKTGAGKHKEKDFWRSAIKSEVMDSYVTVTTNMADLKLSLKDFMALKEGDELQIGDPTVVYVCMNDLKVYRALAGQSNSKLVVKIVGQV
jgi:flagellar motor switch protein FliM